MAESESGYGAALSRLSAIKRKVRRHRSGEIKKKAKGILKAVKLSDVPVETLFDMLRMEKKQQGTKKNPSREDACVGKLVIDRDCGYTTRPCRPAPTVTPYPGLGSHLNRKHNNLSHSAL